MNCDELLMCAEQPHDTKSSDLMVKKGRLYSLAVSGKTRQYLGTEITLEQMQKLSEQEIEIYYSRYESKLGSKMVQSLGHTLINLYAKAVSKLVSIDSEQELKYDLERDPVLTKGLESVGCDLYYRFGGLLAPLSMGLITFNHINFENIIFWDTKNERTDRTSSGHGTENTSSGTEDNSDAK